MLRAHAEYYLSSGQFDRAQKLLADGAVSLEIPPESEIDTIVTALAGADDTIEPEDLIDFLEVRGAADPRAQAVSHTCLCASLAHRAPLALCFTGLALHCVCVSLARGVTGTVRRWLCSCLCDGAITASIGGRRRCLTQTQRRRHRRKCSIFLKSFTLEQM